MNIAELAKHLEEYSERDRKKAEELTVPYIKGLHQGYADAYSLCAKWMKEYMEAKNGNDKDTN